MAHTVKEAVKSYTPYEGPAEERHLRYKRQKRAEHLMSDGGTVSNYGPNVQQNEWKREKRADHLMSDGGTASNFGPNEAQREKRADHLMSDGGTASNYAPNVRANEQRRQSLAEHVSAGGTVSNFGPNEYARQKKHDLAHNWNCSLVERLPRAAVAITIIRSLAFSSGTAPHPFIKKKYVERACPETDIATQLLERRASAVVINRQEEALWWVGAYSAELEEGGYSPTMSDRTFAGQIVAAVCGADRSMRKQAAEMLVGCATGTSERCLASSASEGVAAQVEMLESAGFVGKEERRAVRNAKIARRAASVSSSMA
jgi:hypothetical protein